MSGVARLSRGMSKLSVPAGTNDSNVPKWVYVFEAWWGFSIKYFIPWAIWWLLLVLLREDLPTAENNGVGYGGYHAFWQWMGLVYPLVGLACFIIPLFLSKTPEPFGPEVEEAFRMEWIQNDKEIEMTKQ